MRFRPLLAGAVYALTLATAASAQQSEPTRLTLEKPVRRQLSAGQSHTYAIDLRAGEYLDAVIEQKGIDVAATLVDPFGTSVREFDSPTGALGDEHVRYVAASGGTHRLQLRALQPEADTGAYDMRIATLRVATEADGKTELAVQVSADADRLRAVAETRAQSIERYREAQRLWQAAADRAGEASALRALGFAYVRLKQDAPAFEVFTEAQRMFRELGDSRSEAYIYLIIANIEARRGDPRQALATTGLSLPLWRSATDPEQEAFTLAAMGTLQAHLGDSRQARQLHDDALRVARTTRRPTLQAAMLQSAGSTAQILDDRNAALNKYDAALKLWRQAGQRRGQASSHFAIAGVQESLGNTAAAVQHYESAADFWRQAGVADQERAARARIEALKTRSRLVG